MSDKTRIGFIGVGLMGHGIARNLIEKGGYPLTILGHRNRQPVEDLVARGAREAKDAAEIAAASDVVILCVPSSVEVEAAFAGERGLMQAARPGTIFVDTTTADPAVTRRLGAELAARGCHFVDAALGRTPKEAEAGKLATYVGGDPAIIAKLRPIFEAYTDKIVVCGPLGAGTTCKLVNNSITMGMTAVFAEGIATAAKVGADLGALCEVLSAGGVAGRMWDMMRPWVEAGDDSALRGPIRIGAKDIRTFTRMAESAGMVTFVAQAVNQVLRQAENQGHGERFLPVMPGIVAQWNGTKIRDL